MAGKRLVLLALAILAGCGRERASSPAADGATRDLQRPAMDASSRLNDRAATSSASKTTQKPVAKQAIKPMPRTLAAGTAISAKFDDAINSRIHRAGQKLTGTMGTNVRDWLVNVIAAGQRGSADLVAYFFLRAKKASTCSTS